MGKIPKISIGLEFVEQTQAKKLTTFKCRGFVIFQAVIFHHWSSSSFQRNYPYSDIEFQGPFLTLDIIKHDNEFYFRTVISAT